VGGGNVRVTVAADDSKLALEVQPTQQVVTA